MKKILISLLALSPFFTVAHAAVPKVGEAAPTFQTTTHEGKPFELADRKGKGWTVLFFYPKAGTPGCTKQACAFRDSIKVIRAQKAEVYGISADTVEAQAKFHKEHNLSFVLLADAHADVIKKYNAKMSDHDLAQRWTFILDPDLKVRWFDDKVDPVMDAKKVSDQLAALQKTK